MLNMTTLYEDFLAMCGGDHERVLAYIARSVRTSSGVEGIVIPVSDLERKYFGDPNDQERIDRSTRGTD